MPPESANFPPMTTPRLSGGCLEDEEVFMGKDSFVTQLLRRWTSGDAEALDALIEAVHEELHRIAAQCFRGERREHTLQATALLNEAVLRLIDLDSVDWSDRGHFYAVTARMMRRILVDHARQHARLKRGGGASPVTLAEAEVLAVDGKSPDLVALDEALDRLEVRHERMAKIVQLRFFAGLTSEEIGRSLGISVPTVTREWRRARLWLYSELSGEPIDE
jgi:RNA polymerase sigma factor (TIGR02999 family)